MVVECYKFSYFFTKCLLNSSLILKNKHVPILNMILNKKKIRTCFLFIKEPTIKKSIDKFEYRLFLSHNSQMFNYFSELF